MDEDRIEEMRINSFVRPTITVLLVGVFCYLAVIGKIEAQTFVGTLTMVITWWFKSRDEQKKS